MDAPPPSCSHDAGTQKTNGTACGCDADCASGFCVDGVCCNSACTDDLQVLQHGLSARDLQLRRRRRPAAHACGLPEERPSPPAAWTAPATAKGAAAATSPARFASPARATAPRSAASASATAAAAARPGRPPSARRSIATRKTNSCVVTCSSDADCAGSVKCVNGSCGKRPIGAVCTAANQCASASAPTGSAATCLHRPLRQLQPERAHRHLLADGAWASPTRTRSAPPPTSRPAGRPAPATAWAGAPSTRPRRSASPPPCSGDRLNTAGTCDGLGTCRAQGIQACVPYRCSGTACVSHCASDADCISGHTCVNGSCGPKAPGPAVLGRQRVRQRLLRGRRLLRRRPAPAAAAAARCRRRWGPARPSRWAPATRTASASISMPRLAAPTGPATAPAGCHKYPTRDRVRAREMRERRLHARSRPATRTATAAPPTPSGARPYVCNGARCFTRLQRQRTTGVLDRERVRPELLRPQAERRLLLGRHASASPVSARRASAARPPARASCFSCAMTGTMGLCTAVPTGLPDPAGLCTDKGPASCGTDGKCQAGACQKYPQGTACANASCPMPGSTFTAGRHLRRRRHLHGPRPRRRASRSRAASTPASRPAPPTPTARRPPPATRDRAGSSRTAPSARRAPNARAPSAPRASAARPPARASACRARSPGPRAPARPSRPAERRSDRPVHGPGRGHLRHDRRRATAAAAAPSTRPERSARLPPAPARRWPAWRAPATAPAACKPAATQTCAPFACNAATQSCVVGLHGGRRLRGRAVLHERLVRPQAPGPDLLGRQRVRQRQLRRRRLLLGGQLRQLPGLQPDRQRRHLRAGSAGRRRAAPALRGRPALRVRRHLQRRGRLPQHQRGHQLRHCQLHERDRQGRRRLRRRRHLHADVAVACPGHLQCGGTDLPDDLLGQHRLRDRLHLPVGHLHEPEAAGDGLHQRTECLSGACTEGVCCGSADLRHLRVLQRHRPQPGPARPLAAGTAVPPACAPTWGAPAAGPTAPATAPATARPTPPGPPAPPAACTAGTATLVATSKCDSAGKCVPGADHRLHPAGLRQRRLHQRLRHAGRLRPGLQLRGPG